MPITRYCDEHRLTPRERLELFVPVCQAVQHAHQKGIIHRDLKPTNVMVCLYDDKPVPKVIDFGLAKAAGIKLTERTLFTEFGSIVGTLEYMSPEQAQLNQLDIDTRSDIYSLGVLLVRAAHRDDAACGRERFQDTAVLEVLRLIREEEPQRPSVRLSTDPGAAVGRRQSRLGAGRAERTRSRRARLDRDEGAREGPQPALRDGQRAGPRYRAVPAQRVGAGLSARRPGIASTSSAVGIAEPCWPGVCCFSALLAGFVGTTVGLLQAHALPRKAERLALAGRAGQAKARRGGDRRPKRRGSHSRGVWPTK